MTSADVGASSTRAGALILVATPIGNLGDLSPRAHAALTKADTIACEDSRRTGHLLLLVGIAAAGRLLVLNDHNELARIGHILDRLALGQRVVVVSDAGMPGISDPGERLVAAAAEAGHVVEVIPGASAAITALVASGLPTGRFCFEGFLPRKAGARAERLEALLEEQRTMIFYEAPHRVVDTIADLARVFGGERPVAVARELTKLHEHMFRGALRDAAAAINPRGEFVLVVGGAPAPVAATDAVISEALAEAFRGGVTVRDAATDIAARFNVTRRRAYDLALHVRDTAREP